MKITIKSNLEVSKSVRKGCGIMGTRVFKDKKKAANKNACRKGGW